MSIKYLEINIHPEVEPEDFNFVMSKTVSRLHGIFRSQEVRAGLDFPLATESSLGSRLRVFGRTPVLNAVLNNSGIHSLQRRRMISLEPVRDVPENARKIQLKRVRNRDKNELLKKARKKRKHLLAKGVDAGEIESVITLKAKRRNRERIPYFLVEKNGRKHSVFFKWEMAPEDMEWSEYGFNSYGLSSNGRGCVFRF